MFDTQPPNARVRATQSWSAIGETSFPDGITKVGGASVTPTFGDDQGSVKIECANVDGGIQSEPFVPSNFSEIRLGAAFKTDAPENNTLSIGLVGASGSIDDLPDEDKRRIYQYDGGDPTVEVNTNKVGLLAGLPSFRGNAWKTVELRWKIDEADVQVVLPDDHGGQVHGEWNVDVPTTEYYPSWGVNTATTGGTHSLWLANIWYDVRF